MLEKNIDTVVLGCTHYPYVIPMIQQIVGENVRVIDPAPAIAKQAGRLLEARAMRNQSQLRGDVKFYTSGNPEVLKSLLLVLLEESSKVEGVDWMNEQVIARA
jgi:glutamate racemase